MTFIVMRIKAVIAVYGATIAGTEGNLGNNTAGRADGVMHFTLRGWLFPPGFVKPLLSDDSATRASTGGVTKAFFCEISLLFARKNEGGFAITAD